MPAPWSPRDEKLAHRFKQTRQHGETSRYHHEFVGGNFRMDALQAAVLNVKLSYLERWNNRRRAIAAYYTSRFAGTDVMPPVERPAPITSTINTSSASPRSATPCAITSAKQGIGCNIFYPSRCTCRNALPIWATRRASSRLPRRRARKCSPCPCSRN